MASDDGSPGGTRDAQSPGSPAETHGVDRSVSDGKHVAVRLLAGREHARGELITKLGQRGWTPSQCEQIIEELVADGLQSDERFAESFVRARTQKAYGPVRIRAELQQRGIDRGLIKPFDPRRRTGWHWHRIGMSAATDQNRRLIIKSAASAKTPWPGAVSPQTLSVSW